jgi:predicted acyltransferase
MLSVDALRGFDMFWIAGVDGVIYAIHEIWPSKTFGLFADQFEHKPWEGFVFYDLIFPLFVFLVGVTTVFSLGKLIEREGKAAAYKRISRRFFLLYFVALIYNGSFWGEHVRLIGVLQRIAWCYLFTSLLFCHLRLRGLIVVLAGILIGYWALLTFVPPPGEPAPTYAMHKNWSNWIDKHYLLEGDMEPRGWRNEGYLSTLPAVATCILGTFAGVLLLDKRLTDAQKVARLLAAGVALLLVGYLWGLQFPVIKRIWTSTYVLVAGGYSALLLGAFYYVVDMRKRRSWATPFFWIGSNAIVAYVMAGLAPWEWVQRPFVEVLAPAIGDSADVLAAALVPCGVIAAMYGLYRKRWFLRV